jgi:hypothetical protein
LRGLGWTEGHNLIIEVPSTEGQADRFRELATELDRLNLDVVVAFGALAALAAKDVLRPLRAMIRSAAGRQG